MNQISDTVKVFATWVQGKTGTIHFDVMTTDGDTALRLAKTYLARLNEADAVITTGECQYCHNEPLAFFSQAVELAGQGFVPAGAYGNRQSFSDFITYIKDVNLELQDLIFDPQTSGGLLMALPEGEAEALLKELGEAGIVAACVGRMHEPQSEGFGKEAGQLFVV